MSKRIESAMPLAKSMGLKHAARTGLDRDDCIGEAYMALTAADRAYKGASEDFPRYASGTVRNALRRAYLTATPDQEYLIDYGLTSDDTMDCLLARGYWQDMLDADAVGANLWYAVNVEGLTVGAAATESGLDWRSAQKKMSKVCSVLSEMLQKDAEK